MSVGAVLAELAVVVLIEELASLSFPVVVGQVHHFHLYFSRYLLKLEFMSFKYNSLHLL